jgi:predicted RNA binding protein YcfA (HicA-like mRNA interferase family)
MTSADKRLARMRGNPRGDWVIEDLEVVARAHGMTIRKTSGSHVVFSHPDSRTHLTVPARRPIKPVYVRDFVALVDEIEGQA